MSLARLALSSARCPNSRFLRIAGLMLCVSGLGLSAFAGTRCVNPGGTGGCYKTIGAAVTAAVSNDTINVAPGIYAEQVTITKPLSLISTSLHGAVIDATGKANGIMISGMSGAPAHNLYFVVISGFVVRNAKYEGILAANASNVTIVDNLVTANDTALNISTPACPGIPAFETNESEDCGEGIHLMAVDHSSIIRNEVSQNAGGILVSDETGSTYDNLISLNFVHNNPYDCGITLASHGPATSVIPTAKLPYGISRNVISHNRSWTNGTKQPGAGAGIGIFAPFPGTLNAENVVSDNDVEDNGLPGITMHNHAYSPSGPPVVMNNNHFINNVLVNNAADTDDAATGGPTGINIYSVAPVYGTLIEQNRFDDESYDIVFRAPGTIIARFNDFDTGVGVDNLGAGYVEAAQNWWDCPTGPGSGQCASVAGPRVNASPWLLRSFGPGDPDDY
jgi:hypothetical protein